MRYVITQSHSYMKSHERNTKKKNTKKLIKRFFAKLYLEYKLKAQCIDLKKVDELRHSK